MSERRFDDPNASGSGGARRKRHTEDYERAWQGFPELKGSHWAVRPVGRDLALVTSDGGNVLATVGESREREIPEDDGALILLRLTGGTKEIRVAGGLLYRWQRLGGRLSDDWQFVEADSGLPIFKGDGRSLNRRDFRTLQLLSDGAQRAAGSEFLRFSVEGTKPENTVMSAADDSGRTILRFRLAYSIPDGPGWRRRLFGLSLQKYRGTEIVLSPGLKAVPELLLIAACASPWISTTTTGVARAGDGRARSTDRAARAR
jgi:hypothetical protein